jgi:polar amino acid transport system ATP-binding protein
MATLERVGDAVMRAIAVHLGLPHEYFAERWLGDAPCHLFRVLRYPPVPAGAQLPVQGIGEHSDFGALAILAADQPGLEALANAAGAISSTGAIAASTGALAASTGALAASTGAFAAPPPSPDQSGTSRGSPGPAAAQWVPVPVVPNALTVNAGDCLELWTGGRVRATRHRVLRSGAGAALPRLSFPFFYEPDFEARIDTVAGLKPRPGFVPSMGKAAGFRYGDHIVEAFARSYPQHATSQ